MRVIRPVAVGLRAAALVSSWISDAVAVELAWALHGELCFGPICKRLLGLRMDRLTPDEVQQRVTEWLEGRLARSVRASFRSSR